MLRAARHALITFDELRALHLSPDEIDYRVAVGRLHRKYTGVFAVGRPDLTLDGVFLAAVLACGPKAKLSHLSALRKWELRRGGTYKIDVTAPRSIKPKRGIRLHRPLLHREGRSAIHAQRARGSGAVAVSLILGARARNQRMGLGRRQARRGRLPLARARTDRRGRRRALPLHALPAPRRFPDVAINGTPAQVAATILTAMSGPRKR